MRIRAVVYHANGKPESVCRVEEVELAAPASREARVRVLFAPINPADINMIEGTYGVRSTFPAIPGIEGVGVVEELGCDLESLAVGDRVLLPAGAGSWAEACNVEAARLTVVPSGIAPEQAAMLRVNPATALRMLRDFVTLKPGDWVIQNAANSGVGRAVIQIAKQQGVRLINVVRRPELIDALKAEGADVVLLDREELRTEVAAVTDGAPIRLALNCVGGESALQLAKTVHEGGTIVTFGAMGKQPLRIPNGLLIFKDLRWVGFWITRWYGEASVEMRTEMFGEIFNLSLGGQIGTPIERIYPLGELEEALERAQQSGRAGKILLTLNG